MRKIILHIGAHKTASTYIQKLLSDNYAYFLSKGVIYLREWRDFLWGHHTLVEKICSNKISEEEFLDAIENEFSIVGDDGVLVISSENFESVGDRAIKFLSCLNKKYDVSIIYCWRSFQSSSYSSWQEAVKHGSDINFEAYTLKHFLTPFQSNLINFSNILRKYDQYFNSKIKVINYDYFIANDVDIFEYFSKEFLMLEVSIDDLILPQKKINVSFSPDDVEVIRALNSYINSNIEKISGNVVREAYVQLKSKREMIKDIIFDFEGDYRKITMSANNSIVFNVLIYIKNNFPEYFSLNSGILPELKDFEYRFISPETWMKASNYSNLKDLADCVVGYINEKK